MENETKSILAGLRHIAGQLNELKQDKVQDSAPVSKELPMLPLHSVEVNKILIARFKARQELKGLTKDSKGFGYKYTKLDALIGFIEPILEKHNLLLEQPTTEDGILHTRLWHVESSQWMASRWKLRIADGSLKGQSMEQETGTINTYTRRYQTLSLLGIHPCDDTDGTTRR